MGMVEKGVFTPNPAACTAWSTSICCQRCWELHKGRRRVQNILYIAGVHGIFIQSSSQRGWGVFSCKGFSAFGDPSKQGSRGIRGLACFQKGCLWIKRLWEELLDFAALFGLLGFFLINFITASES